MKLAFSTLGCPNYDMGRIIQTAADNGYAGVELRAVEGTLELWNAPSLKGDGLKETVKRLGDTGVAVAGIGTDIRFSQVPGGDTEQQLENAKRYMALAEALGCGYLRTYGGPLNPTMGYLESIWQIREGYEKLCELTAKSSIMPLIETHDDFSTFARVKNILDGVTHPNLGVIWDILHPYRHGEAVADTVAGLGGRIRHVHVKDGKNLSSKGFNLVLTGRGDMPVGDCVDTLRRIGYEGYLSFEWEKMWQPEIEEPEVALPHYARVMRERFLQPLSVSAV